MTDTKTKTREIPAAITLTPAAEQRIADLMAKAPEDAIGVKLSTLVELDRGDDDSLLIDFCRKRQRTGRHTTNVCVVGARSDKEGRFLLLWP